MTTSLVWTTDKPTGPRFYWLEQTLVVPSDLSSPSSEMVVQVFSNVVEVYGPPRELLVQATPHNHGGKLSGFADTCRWAGPLPKPNKPIEANGPTEREAEQTLRDKWNAQREAGDPLAIQPSPEPTCKYCRPSEADMIGAPDHPPIEIRVSHLEQQVAGVVERGDEHNKRLSTISARLHSLEDWQFTIKNQIATLKKHTRSHDDRLIGAFGRLHSLELRCSISGKSALVAKRLDDLEIRLASIENPNVPPK